MKLSFAGVFICACSGCLAPSVVFADVEGFEPPPIHSQGDARFGKPPVRLQSLSAVAAEIVEIGQRGTWRLDKRWEIILNSLQSSEVPVLLDTVARLTPSDAREGLRSALYSRWAETDPQAAMQHLGQEADPATRGSCLEALFKGWAHANAAELEAWAAPLSPGAVKMMAYIAAAPYTAANGGGAKSPVDTGNSSTAGATPRDPRAALAEAAKVPEREKRLAIYKSIAKEWAAADPKAATDWALELPIAAERDALLELTASTWARSDAEKAAAFLAGHSQVSRYLLQQAVSNWAARDLAGVVRWAQRLPEAKQRNEVLMSILGPWLDRSPDAAADFIVSLPVDGPDFYNAASMATSRWVEAEPDRVFALWRRLPPDAVARLLGGDSLRSLMRSSPERLIGFLRELPAGRRAEPYAQAIALLAAKDTIAAKRQLAALAEESDGVAIRRLVLQRVLETNRDFALELYGDLPPGQPQAEALRSITDQWSRKDPAKALAWVRTLPNSPLTQGVMQTIIRQMGQTDPEAALRELAALRPSPGRKAAAADLIASWATKDFAAARAQLEKEPEGEERESALVMMAQRIGYGTPTKALELLNPCDASPERMNAAQQIISQWVQNDSAAALRWAEQQPSIPLREAVLLASMYPLSQTSPAAAAGLVDRLTLRENVQRGVAIVAQAWTPFDPAAASRWAQERPAGPLRDQAIAVVGGYWLQQDRSAAAAWLNALPAEFVPDEAWRQFAQNLLARQPAEAMRCAAKLKNPTARDELTIQLARYWLQRDAAAAEKWIAESDLSEEQKKRIRASRERPL